MTADNHQYGDLKIGIYMNGSPELLQLDISYLNMRFVHIKSKELEECLQAVSYTGFYKTNRLDFDELIKHELETFMYVIIPIDTSKPVEYTMFRDVMKAILIPCPSSFKLLRVVTYTLHDDEELKYYYFYTTFHITNVPSLPEPISITNVERVNLFIKDYFERTNDYKYLDFTINYYVNSFAHNDKYMAFINLCISLEALILGDGEITYKIQRCCAVINSSNPEEGRLLFKNVRNLYTHRSKIVHGEGGNPELLRDHLDYLISLVSRTIITLLMTPIKNKEDLNLILNETGFGQSGSQFLEGQKYPSPQQLPNSLGEELKPYKVYKPKN